MFESDAFGRQGGIDNERRSDRESVNYCKDASNREGLRVDQEKDPNHDYAEAQHDCSADSPTIRNEAHAELDRLEKIKKLRRLPYILTHDEIIAILFDTLRMREHPAITVLYTRLDWKV
jgi:hypothetical protein